MSGTPLNSHKNEAHLERGLYNPVANCMNETVRKDRYGIVSDDLENYLDDPNLWTKIIS